MKLKSIQLAGFKSFADPTIIPFPDKLTAIVGPNGCGKSNIVDALRWVIGESSAKQLRGGQLSDVIFSGTTHRKPVGQASVELLFDNTNELLGGEYARYHEINIRRELTREGHSQFYLNGTRCRRRDITDLFLGTGLGPNSYAIIEQGIISKLVEGKPEELRTYIEEAAGTSKYRERRRETENRLRHTRENLDRLNDIRLELEKQLDQLKRHVQTAERYKKLKEEQRLLKAQTHMLECISLERALSTQQTAFDTDTEQLNTQSNQLQCLDIEIEQHRLLQAERQTQHTDVQARYYQIDSALSAQTQKIEYIQTLNQQLAEDLAKLKATLQQTEQHLNEDEQQIIVLDQTLTELAPQAEDIMQQAQASVEALQAIEKKRADYQIEWEQFATSLHHLQRKIEVNQTSLNHLTQRNQHLSERLHTVEQQQSKLHVADLPEQMTVLSEQSATLKAQIEGAQENVAALNQRIQQQQQANHQLHQIRDAQQKAIHQLQTQQASLKALQQAAVGLHRPETDQWLKKQGWENRTRLLDAIDVETGWEAAVETVLAPYIEAIATEAPEDFQQAVEQFKAGQLVLINCGSATLNYPHPPYGYPLPEGEGALCQKDDAILPLASVFRSEWNLSALISGIYVTDTFQTALTHLSNLADHESIVTQDGIWLGKTWLRIHKGSDKTSGVLQRKHQLQALETQLQKEQATLEDQILKSQTGLADLKTLEQERESQQQIIRQLSAQHSDTHSRFTAHQARLEQFHIQEKTLLEEKEKLKQQIKAVETEWVTANQLHEINRTDQEALEKNKITWPTQKTDLEAQVRQHKKQTELDKQAAETYRVKQATLQNQLHYLKQNRERAEKHHTELQQRQTEILKRQSDLQNPLPELKTALETLLQEKTTVEKSVQLQKQALTELETNLHRHEKKRLEVEKDIQRLREQLQNIRITQTTAQTHREHHLQQIMETGYELDALKNTLSNNITINVTQANLQQIDSKIQRLGAINLAAIEDYQQQLERKTYLDNQTADLCEALTTLEEAIKKMDKESRVRLKETFDQANTRFKSLFTLMFGGGEAELTWVGEEVLNAGVAIRAQPPGKRNTLLHLLSGGEKALTAIALVFALFQLNPAPFCVLDEVDAPLDDANVVRFCKLVESMSDTVQFLFVTHNQTAMEMAKHMVGITMQEPGISRLVSVDMEQILLANE